MQVGEPTAADRIVIADLDANGELDDSEMRRATEMRFSWLDRNSDGNLDQGEMQSGFGIRVRPGDWVVTAEDEPAEKPVDGRRTRVPVRAIRGTHRAPAPHLH